MRRILRRVVTAPDRIGDLALEYFGEQGIELELPSRQQHDPIDVGA